MKSRFKGLGNKVTGAIRKTGREMVAHGQELYGTGTITETVAEGTQHVLELNPPIHEGNSQFSLLGREQPSIYGRPAHPYVYELRDQLERSEWATAELAAASLMLHQVTVITKRPNSILPIGLVDALGGAMLAMHRRLEVVRFASAAALGEHPYNGYTVTRSDPVPPEGPARAT